MLAVKVRFQFALTTFKLKAFGTFQLCTPLKAALFDLSGVVIEGFS